MSKKAIGLNKNDNLTPINSIADLSPIQLNEKSSKSTINTCRTQKFTQNF